MPNPWRGHSRRILMGNEVIKFKRAFKDNFVTLIISSFGLLVALTWNGFWNAWIATLPIEQSIPYKFMLALGITLMAVTLTYALTKLKSSN